MCRFRYPLSSRSGLFAPAHRGVTLVLLVLALLSASRSPTAGALAASASQTNPSRLSELSIGMMVHPASLEYFNGIARQDDIGALLVINTRLLPRISTGKRLVMSPSMELARERASDFVDQTDYLGYNIEHWPDTPDVEKSDPVAASAAAAEFARQYGLDYVIGPDLDFTENFGAELARSADIYVIQGQRLQESPSRFQAVVTEFAAGVRSGNPDVDVWVQVSSSFGTPEDTVAVLEAIESQIDGIWIHYNQNSRSFAALQDLVRLLRPANSAPAPTSTPAAAAPVPALPTTDVELGEPPATPDGVLPTSTSPAPTPVPVATSLPLELTPEPLQESVLVPWLPVIGGAMIVLAGGFVGLGFALGYLWRGGRD